MEVSAAPPRRHCPPQCQLGAEGTETGLPRNILEGGAFLLEKGSLAAANWRSSFDGWPPRTKEDRPVERRQSLRPLRPRPLPLSVSYWRIFQCVFNEEEGERNAASTNPGPGQVSAGGRIGQNTVPECTGTFWSLWFSRAVLPLLLKVPWLVTKKKKKKSRLRFHFKWRGGGFFMG